VNIRPEQLLQALQAGQEARYQAERQSFLRRHARVSVSWLMFCLGYALGVGLMLAAR